MLNEESRILSVHHKLFMRFIIYLPGGRGDFVVHLSNNRMFYGRAFVEHVVEVKICR